MTFKLLERVKDYETLCTWVSILDTNQTRTPNLCLDSVCPPWFLQSCRKSFQLICFLIICMVRIKRQSRIVAKSKIKAFNSERLGTDFPTSLFRSCVIKQTPQCPWACSSSVKSGNICFKSTFVRTEGKNRREVVSTVPGVRKYPVSVLHHCELLCRKPQRS